MFSTSSTKSGSKLRTNIAIYASALMVTADAVLLTSVFRALERDFLVGPSILGTLSLCQSLSQSLSSPIWGYFADNYLRTKLLCIGSLIIAISTALVGLSGSIFAIAIARILTGIGIASVGPITQSLIADMESPTKRGAAFGLLGVCAAIGSILGNIFATSISQQKIYGISGWRFAFYFISFISFLFSLWLSKLNYEPTRGDTELTQKSQSKNSITSFTTFLTWKTDILHFFKIKTFLFLAFQGFLGNIPWHAMQFVTMYFQFIGFSDIESSSMFAALNMGGMFGKFFGGYIGDVMSNRLPNYGRVIVAQTSVFLGIPCVYILFQVIPQNTNYKWIFVSILFIQGCVCTWCAAGCNRPILAEIVKSKNRASVYAVLHSLEGSMGSLGSPLVGVLSEIFGYKYSSVAVSDMSFELRQSNLDALSRAAVFVTVIPWTICFLLYGLIHFVYPYERKRT